MPGPRISVPAGRAPKPAVIILPPKNSGEHCPHGWEAFQREEAYAVYTLTDPKILIGIAATLEEAQAIAAAFQPN